MPRRIQSTGALPSELVGPGRLWVDSCSVSSLFTLPNMIFGIVNFYGAKPSVLTNASVERR